MVKVTLKYRKIHELTVNYFKSVVKDNERIKQEERDKLCDLLTSLTDVTIENVRTCVRTLESNSDNMLDRDSAHNLRYENIVLEKLTESIKFEKSTCSICFEKIVTHQHCTRCLGRDTVVCKGCIIQMLKYARIPTPRVWYECPHCRLLITQPKWTLSNPKALRKIIALQKQFIEWVMESESEEDLTDGELMDSELVDGELGDGELMDGELMDGDEHGLFNL